MTSVSWNSNGLIINNGKILTTREKGRKLCLLPGGGVEENETPKQALIRELKEELGIEASGRDLEPWGEYSAAATGRKTVRKVHLFFIEKWAGTPHPQGEVKELVWLDRQNSSTLNL